MHITNPIKSMKKLKLNNTNAKPVLHVSREALRKEKICYLAVSNKDIEYPYRKSRIAYIGTSERGHKRMLESAGRIAGKVLQKYGITGIDFHVVSCRGKRGGRSWEWLEKALLLSFKGIYGSVPFANKQGKGRNDEWGHCLNRFNRESIERYLRKFEK